jgi:hypothetical protein
VPLAYAGVVLDLSAVDLDAIAEALADQNAHELRWLMDPSSGQTVIWSPDTGVDGQHPVDLDELDLIRIDPLPSYIWYQDLADFAESVTNEQARRRLLRAIDGKGAFRRFKDELHGVHPDLVPAWHAFLETRARRRAVDWLVAKSLVDEAVAGRFLADHPDPAVP